MIAEAQVEPAAGPLGSEMKVLSRSRKAAEDEVRGREGVLA